MRGLGPAESVASYQVFLRLLGKAVLTVLADVYLLPLVLSGVTCSFVVALGVRYRTFPGGKPLAVMGVGHLWWIVFYAGQLLAWTEALTLTFARLQWLGPPSYSSPGSRSPSNTPGVERD